MNDETTNLDQADEEVLTYTASDEALEAAAGKNQPCPAGSFVSYAPPRCCPTHAWEM